MSRIPQHAIIRSGQESPLLFLRDKRKRVCPLTHIGFVLQEGYTARGRGVRDPPPGTSTLEFPSVPSKGASEVTAPIDAKFVYQDPTAALVQFSVNIPILFAPHSNRNLKRKSYGTSSLL
ncbi:hypothetical protein CEXT_369041 [Caerostris extrusa]|uniref:Uncharacterized protein n=1 Tax=Caerostris extrusa TaxID=172846 RepID=A0AAV4YBM8_CAEEX|nr:hypothetical protein CEXT_369041 [Caerostris extrusa]